MIFFKPLFFAATGILALSGCNTEGPAKKKAKGGFFAREYGYHRISGRKLL